MKLQAADELGIELPEGAVAGRARRIRHRTRPDRRGRAAGARGAPDRPRRPWTTSSSRGSSGARCSTSASAPAPRPSEADLDAALELAATQPVEMLTLAEIALPFAERGEAETQALADGLYRQLAGGADFAAARRRVQPQPDRARTAGGSSRCPANRLPPTFRTEVLLLRPGQVTRPVPISGGLAIIKLVSVNQVRPEPVDAADPAVREELRQRLFGERIAELRPGLPPGAARRRAHRRAMTAPVALTLGDPAGIGGEIALRAWAALRRRPGLLPDRRPRPHGGARRAGSACRCGRSTRRPRPPRRWPRACRCSTTRCRIRRPPAAPTRATPPPSSRSSPAPSRSPTAGEALAVCTNPIAKAAAEGRAPASPSPATPSTSPHLCGAAAAGDDAGRPGAAGGAGDDPHPARRGSGRADRRPARGDAARHPPRRSSPTSASPRRASRSPGSTRTPARPAPWAARRSR